AARGRWRRPSSLAPARRGTCAMLPSEVCSPGADHTPQVIWAAISTSSQPQVRGGDERLDRLAGLLERGPTSFLSVHDGQDAEDQIGRPPPGGEAREPESADHAKAFARHGGATRIDVERRMAPGSEGEIPARDGALPQELAEAAL